jgi:hypothetical protein
MCPRTTIDKKDAAKKFEIFVIDNFLALRVSREDHKLSDSLATQFKEFSSMKKVSQEFKALNYSPHQSLTVR